MNENVQAFIANTCSLIAKITIYLAIKAEILSLLVKEVTNIAKYSDFADIFLEKSAEILLK